MLKLELSNGVHEFAPGGTVSGELSWTLARPPRDAAIKLIWYTEGKGTQDVAVVERQPLPATSATYRAPFQFQLPLAPYSCTGRLIALKWAVELVLDGGKTATRENILLSPWEKEPVLEAFSGEPH